MLYLLIAYIIFLVLFALYSVLGLYHLWRYGYIGDLTKPVIIIYAIFAAAIVVTSFIVIAFRPWPAGFSLL